MTTLTVKVNDLIKKQAQKRSKDEWVTLTFVINKLLQAYNSWKAQFNLSFETDGDFKNTAKQFQRVAKKIDKKDLASLKAQLSDI